MVCVVIHFHIVDYCTHNKFPMGGGGGMGISNTQEYTEQWPLVTKATIQALFRLHENNPVQYKPTQLTIPIKLKQYMLLATRHRVWASTTTVHVWESYKEKLTEWPAAKLSMPSGVSHS